MNQPQLTLILSTYNQPAWLEKALLGYAEQSTHAFELIVADDGSRSDTKALLDSMRARMPFVMRHVWHEDRGFRKCAILNTAIAAAATDYLLFSDGDCIPRADFVAQHLEQRRPACFLSGGYLKLPRKLSHAITPADIQSGRFADPAWLLAHGLQLTKKLLKLSLVGRAADAMNALTTTAPTWNGHNASCWKHDMERINGFDERMGWGGEDRELGERLNRIGIRGKQIRYSAIVVHLDHDRGYATREVIEENGRIRRLGRRTGATYCTTGIVKPRPEAGLVVDGTPDRAA